MKNYFQYFACVSLVLAFLTTFLTGQDIRDTDDVIRIETNMVFVDVLVREKRSRAVVADLNREDFRLFVDGKPRDISSFGLDGTGRVPLTIVLFLNLAPEGALRFLTESKYQKALHEGLGELGPNDRVSVVASRDWFVGKPDVIAPPSRDWDSIVSSIGEALNDSTAKRDRQLRTVEKHSMSDALDQVRKLRPIGNDRHTVMVYVSDGVNTLDTFKFADRSSLADQMVRDDIGFGAINFDLKADYAVAANVINPLAYVFGASATGSAKFLAEQTGGISLNASSPEDLGEALSEMIALYGSRYGIGFEIKDSDRDGRKHRLEVRIDNGSIKREKRQLIVNARRSFYASSKQR